MFSVFGSQGPFPVLQTNIVKHDLSKTNRSLVRYLSVAIVTIYRITDNDLSYGTQILKLGQIMNYVTKERRLKKDRKLLS